MTRMDASKARDEFSDALNRVAYKGERIDVEEAKKSLRENRKLPKPIRKRIGHRRDISLCSISSTAFPKGGISYTLEGTLRGPVGRGYFVASEGFRVEHVESRSWCSNTRRGAPGSPAPLREEPGRRHLGIRGPEPASARPGDTGGCARGRADTRGISVRMDATTPWQGRPPNGCDGGRPLPSDRSPGPEVPPACGRHHPKTAPGRCTGRVRSGKVPDAHLGLRRSRRDADAIHSLHGGASGGLPAGCAGCPVKVVFDAIRALMEPPRPPSPRR